MTLTTAFLIGILGSTIAALIVSAVFGYLIRRERRRFCQTCGRRPCVYQGTHP